MRVALATDKNGDTQFITLVEASDKLATIEDPNLPEQTSYSPKPKDALAKLAEFPELSAVLFPLFKTPSKLIQKQALRLTAGRYGMTIEISEYNPRTLLVQNVTKNWKRIQSLTILSPLAVSNWKLAQARSKVTVALPLYDYCDYRMYLKRLMEENANGDEGCGILVPIFNRSIVTQRAQLHNWARELGITVSVKRWDDSNFIVRFTGYRQVYEQKANLVQQLEEAPILSDEDMAKANEEELADNGTMEDLMGGN